MDLSSAVLKERAKTKLKGNYGMAFAACLVYSAIVSVIAGLSSVPTVMQTFRIVSQGGFEDAFQMSVTGSPLTSLGSIVEFLVMGPLQIGLTAFFMRLAVTRQTDINDLFSGFRKFGPALLLTLLIGIFTVLWTLLLIIPGIIASLRYSMAYYILNDNPEMSPTEALNASKEMMKGRCGELFVLHLSFLGWYLLAILTLCVGFMFLEPYRCAAMAEFYYEVSGKNAEATMPPEGGYEEDYTYMTGEYTE